MRRKRLKIFRIEHDLMQSDMANKIGCTREAYSAVETGRRDPSYDFMKNLQAAFDIPDEHMWALLEREK